MAVRSCYLTCHIEINENSTAVATEWGWEEMPMSSARIMIRLALIRRAKEMEKAVANNNVDEIEQDCANVDNNFDDPDDPAPIAGRSKIKNKKNLYMKQVAVF